MDTLQLPPDNDDLGRTLFDYLGTYWNTFYQDKELVRNYCKGSGLEAAQRYLDLIETASALTRTRLPAFHRELVSPFIVAKSTRSNGPRLRLGMEPTVVVGPQEAGSAYIDGATFQIDGRTSLDNTVVYPLVPTPDSGVLRISNDVVNPTVTLVAGLDFYVREGDVYFTAGSDPFELDFPTRNVVRENGDTDEEILLWAYDTMYDWAFMYDHFGANIQYREPSSSRYNKTVNSLYDLRFGGPTVSLFNAAVADLLGVAHTGQEQETVEVVSVDGSQVVTDKAVYEIPSSETLASWVEPGVLADPGSILTTTLRIYPKPGFLESDAKFLAANGQTKDQFLIDVPRLQMPRGLLGNYSATQGLAAVWSDVPLHNDGPDYNGNPKLWFELDGDPADVAAYWQAIWTTAEETQQSLADVFSEYIVGASFLDPIVGEINPLEFYLKNFMRSNTHIIVVDLDALPPYINSLSALTKLPSLLPAHAFLIVVGTTSSPKDDYNLEDALDIVSSFDCAQPAETATAGLPSDSQMTYSERITTRWVRP